MSDFFRENSGVEPIMTARACGGWLARTPPSCSIRMAVIAASEVEAREKFQASLAAWRAIRVKARTPV